MRTVPLAVVCVLAAAAPGLAQQDDKQSFSVIERGRYLTVVGDCEACHTAPGQPPFAGGRPLYTPFGTLVGPNITPATDSGIGSWSDDDFANVLKKGVGPGGEHIYPAMPYTYYTRITRQDAVAIRAYLNTIPPVHNDVKSNQLPFPFNIRASLSGWDALFFKPGEFQPVAGKSDEWNRGAWIVQGLGHCGMCHTPKNALGGDETARALQGYSLQGWYAPNITNDARVGLGGWSVDQIVAYLKTGHNDSAGASGPMAEEISYSSSKMTGADLKAIAVYLKDQGGGTGTATPLSADDPAMRAGQAIYNDQCSACHGRDGTGAKTMFPALKGGPFVQSASADSLLNTVIQGGHSVATDGAPTGPGMPAFGWKLNDDQVAAVLTYIRNAWGNAAPAVTAADARSARKSLASAQVAN